MLIPRYIHQIHITTPTTTYIFLRFHLLDCLAFAYTGFHSAFTRVLHCRQGQGGDDDDCRATLFGSSPHAAFTMLSMARLTAGCAHYICCWWKRGRAACTVHTFMSRQYLLFLLFYTSFVICLILRGSALFHSIESSLLVCMLYIASTKDLFASNRQSSVRSCRDSVFSVEQPRTRPVLWALNR